MGEFSYLLTEAKKIGLDFSNKKPTQKKQRDPFELFKLLAALPFWCYDDHKHLTNPNYHEDFCCLTHVVGLPRHPATKLEMPLTGYQIEFFEAVIKAVTNPGNMTQEEWDRLEHLFHLLKGRQMGFTEIVLRVIQFFCFSRYAGQNIAIMAATNGELANKDQRRFQRLFLKIPEIVKQPIKNRKMILYNLETTDTIIEAFPASEEALTGDTNYACVFMDEAAKWKLVNDTPVFNSVMPIVRSNGADLFLVSTPKGPLKMFYKIYKNPEDFVMLVYDIWRAEGTIYTTAQIEKMLKTTKEDPNQEYLCKFTIGEDSILGAVTDDDRGNFSEWGQVDIDADEDDGYVEEEDDNSPWDE